MNKRQHKELQRICRCYLKRLRYLANKRGLGVWVDNLIQKNKKGECSATEREVNALSRLCNDERITRKEIPKILGKSYRECNDKGDFDKIKKFPHVGIYSKLSTMLYNKKC